MDLKLNKMPGTRQFRSSSIEQRAALDTLGGQVGPIARSSFPRNAFHFHPPLLPLLRLYLLLDAASVLVCCSLVSLA